MIYFKSPPSTENTINALSQGNPQGVRMLKNTPLGPHLGDIPAVPVCLVLLSPPGSFWWSSPRLNQVQGPWVYLTQICLF